MSDLISKAEFRKSVRSGGTGNCVEVATNLADSNDVIFVRDSKDRGGTVLAYTKTEWDAFLAGVRDGEFTV